MKKIGIWPNSGAKINLPVNGYLNHCLIQYEYQRFNFPIF